MDRCAGRREYNCDNVENSVNHHVINQSIMMREREREREGRRTEQKRETERARDRRKNTHACMELMDGRMD